YRLDAAVEAQLMARDDEVEIAKRPPGPVGAEPVFGQPRGALEGDRGDAVSDLQPLGVGQPLVVDGAAIAVHHRLHAEALDALRNARVVTADAAEEPVAVIGDTDEVAAGRQEAQRRQLAEGGRGRAHLETAGEFERAEARLARSAPEMEDGPALDLDRERRLVGPDGRGGGNEGEREKDRRKGSPHRRPATRRAPRWVSSPNRAASCSVIAPASS